MTRRLKGLLFLSLAISVLSAQALSFQAEDVQIKTIRVAEGIYMLQGQGGNIGVSAGKDSTFIIDDQFAPLTVTITKAIEEIAEHPVEFVLNTHWHGDHTCLCLCPDLRLLVGKRARSDGHGQGQRQRQGEATQVPGGLTDFRGHTYVDVYWKSAFSKRSSESIVST